MIPKYRQIKKRSWHDIVFQIIFGFLMLVIIVFLIISNLRISQKRAVLNSQIDKLKEEIMATEERKQRLEAQVSQSSQDEYLEKEAREKLNLKKSGEEVVTIVLPEEKEAEELQKQNFWDRILQRFKF